MLWGDEDVLLPYREVEPALRRLRDVPDRRCCRAAVTCPIWSARGRVRGHSAPAATGGCWACSRASSRAGCALIWSALLLLPAPATAHQQYAPSLVNRYGKLVLADQHGLRLVHTPDGRQHPRVPWRREHDRSRDGRLGPDEQRALCTALGQRMCEGLSLSLDTQPLQPAWEPLSAPSAARPSSRWIAWESCRFSVEISASLACHATLASTCCATKIGSQPRRLARSSCASKKDPARRYWPAGGRRAH